MRYLDGPRPEYGSRQEPLLEVVERLGFCGTPTPIREPRPRQRDLEVTHKNLHRLLKPDETAEGAASPTPGAMTRPPTRTPNRS